MRSVNCGLFLFIGAGFLSLGSCSSESTGQNDLAVSDAKLATYEAGFDSEKDLLVFFAADFEGGPIEGSASATDVSDVPSVENFKKALQGCGESKFLINEGWSHYFYISVPIAENNPFRLDTMNDLALVKCVQSHLAFSFGVGIGREVEVDSTKFESLYAQKN